MIELGPEAKGSLEMLIECFGYEAVLNAIALHAEARKDVPGQELAGQLRSFTENFGYFPAEGE